MVDLENEVLSATYDFCKKYIEPYEKEIELEGKFVRDIFKELGSHGFIALSFPEKYGGLGKSLVLHSKVFPSKTYRVLKP